MNKHATAKEVLVWALRIPESHALSGEDNINASDEYLLGYTDAGESMYDAMKEKFANILSSDKDLVCAPRIRMKYYCELCKHGDRLTKPDPADPKFVKIACNWMVLSRPCHFELKEEPNAVPKSEN